MPDTATEEGTEETTEPEGEESQQSQGLLDEADSNGEVDSEPEGAEPEGDNQEDTDTETDETEVYEPAGELSQDQVESLPDHMVNDDGTVDAEELFKSQQGLREKLSESDDKSEEASESEETDEQETVEIPETPDEYEITIEDDEGNEVDVDDEIKPILQEAAHNSELTEEQLNEFVNNFENGFNENFTRNIDPDEELSKISDDPQEAQKVVNEVNQRIQGMHERGFLSEEEFND